MMLQLKQLRYGNFDAVVVDREARDNRGVKYIKHNAVVALHSSFLFLSWFGRRGGCSIY